ncbi:MAG: twin-arginine translocation signal domain-containing protein, partial [Pseudomonadales bacterium]
MQKCKNTPCEAGHQGSSMTSKKSTTLELLKKVAAEGQKLPAAERRNFLKNGLTLAAGVVAGAGLNSNANASSDAL